MGRIWDVYVDMVEVEIWDLSREPTTFGATEFATFSERRQLLSSAIKPTAKRFIGVGGRETAILVVLHSESMHDFFRNFEADLWVFEPFLVYCVEV